MFDDDEVLVGTLFAGRFRIESELGRGGMGVVYLARHEVLQRQLAIKVIRRDLLADPDIAARFRREARVASRIEHPHITYVFDFGHSDDGRAYIAMEHVEGSTVAEVLAAEGPFPVPRALRVWFQVADALVAAHTSDVLHRDLKPQNIVLTTHRGQPDFVKILDFGLAKIIGLGSSGHLSLDGQSLGTPQYMCPEQCIGEGVDHRCDLYSFGTVAYEMLVGEPPFPFTGNLLEVIGAHLNKQAPVASEVSGRGDIPPELDTLIARCLAKEPEQRFATAVDLRAEIQAMLEAIGEPMTSKARRSGLLPVRTKAYGATLAPLVPLPALGEEQTADETPVPDAWVDPTVADWPGRGDDEAAEEARSRALEELAYALRDNGLGSPEISHVLSLILEEEDRILELETDIAVLQAQAQESEATARERESRLRQALNQLEHEVAMLQPDAVDTAAADTLPLAVTRESLEAADRRAQLEVRIAELIQKIHRISLQLEQELAALNKAVQDKQVTLEELYEEEAKHRAHLVELIRQTRVEALSTDDPELARLFEQASL